MPFGGKSTVLCLASELASVCHFLLDAATAPEKSQNQAQLDVTINGDEDNVSGRQVLAGFPDRPLQPPPTSTQQMLKVYEDFMKIC